jgi:hypothetical protein
MAQEPGQDAAMHRFFVSGTLVELHAIEIFQGPLQLPMQVLPFAHAEVGEEVLAAEFPPCALGSQRFPLIMHPVPKTQQRQEIRLRVHETAVGLVGRLALVERAFARVLDSQASSDDEELSTRVLNGVSAWLAEARPAAILVQGDTTTVLGSAIDSPPSYESRALV